MTTVEILKKARALIEKGWVREHYAIAEDGDLADVFGVGRPPVAFCVEGALTAACGGWYATANRLADLVCSVIPDDKRGNTGASGKLLRWNDAPDRTQAEVLAAFDRAISIAEQPPQAPEKSGP